ncbi:MAG TPA: alpha/beta hydrolase-fold protein [Kofleriaceae bacterium]|nr:alpha/beta hydrolase-fold protein [Kofleriaceae bacterium]
MPTASLARSLALGLPLGLGLGLGLALAACGADDGGSASPDARPAIDAPAGAIDAPPADVDAAPAGTAVRVHYPAGAHTIALRGSGGSLSWTAGTTMTAGGDDTWTLTFADLDAPIELKPLLDDATWSRGPNYHLAPGQTVDLYPHFTSTHGQVTTLVQSFHSDALGDTRTIRAYLPPGYGENTRARYPVVYMHDGQNLFDPATAFGGVEWQVDEAFDAAGETGRCTNGDACGNDGDCGGAGLCLTTREAIVIGIDNDLDRIWELTPTRDASEGDGGGADAYIMMIAGELKPMVDQMLRTQPDAADTAIVGSSLGGLVSAYAGVKKPATFGLVGAMSPSTWWDNRVIIGDVSATAGVTPRPLRVYVDSGDAGPSNDDVTNTTDLAAAYAALGYVEGTTLHHVVQPGGMHNELYWSQRFPGAMFFLLGAGN